jgi:hypothetical protein
MIGSSGKKRRIISEFLCMYYENFADSFRFHAFFHHIDHFKTDYFLWVTASGISAATQSQARKEDASDDEMDVNGEEG